MKANYFPIYCRITTVFLSLATTQVLLGPIKERSRTFNPYLLNLSYIHNGEKISRTITSVFSQPLEQVVSGKVTIEMHFLFCQNFDSYRFWVGGHGNDSTRRQLSQWRVFVSGADGNWINGGAENISFSYVNNKWYSFPLKYKTACINRVLIDVERVSGDNIIRLYNFQLYKKSIYDSFFKNYSSF